MEQAIFIRKVDISMNVSGIKTGRMEKANCSCLTPASTKVCGRMARSKALERKGSYRAKSRPTFTDRYTGLFDNGKRHGGGEIYFPGG